MPTKDRPEKLAEAIEAIRSQDFESWELIIKDAGDASRGIPRDDRITHLRGPDRNVTHALNTAMLHASGQIFNWANDDDPLVAGALSYVDANIGSAMWLRGGVEYVDRVEGTTRILEDEPWDVRRLKMQNPIWTPSVFWRSEATLAIGLMDESVPLASDYDYWIRLADRWPPKVVDRVLARYTRHEGSLSWQNAEQQQNEADRIRARYGVVELEKVRKQLARLELVLEQTRSEAVNAREARVEIEGSQFWRATAPFRWTLSHVYALWRRPDRSRPAAS